MKFAYDSAKSEANLLKHGINFKDAQALWSDPYLLVAEARFADEPRKIAVGRIGPRIWTAVFTTREETIRIISVRPARSEERLRYEYHEN